jgi:hypothetical protein
MHESRMVATALHEVVQTVRERFDEMEVDDDTTQSVAEGLEMTCRKYVGIDAVPGYMDGHEALAFLDEALESASGL